MSSTIDLSAYFQRIGYEGDRRKSIDTIRELHRLHTQAIPFENLDSFLGRPVKLDMESLEEKLILKRRGGYCFEQNLLFMQVLNQLGYAVTGLAGRVLWNKPKEEITRRTHMLLLIYLYNINYIADVGFGSMTLTGPLELAPDTVQVTPHEAYRCVKPEEGSYFLQTQIKNEWNTLYRFDLHREHLIDYEMANWFLSNYPESHFTTHLMVSRPDVGRRYTLHDTTFKIHFLNGKTDVEILKNKDQLRDKLENVFGLDLTGMPELNPRLEQLIK